jgi:hypothetical protein
MTISATPPLWVIPLEHRAASRQQSIDALSMPIDRLATIPGNEEVLEVIRQRLVSPIKENAPLVIVPLVTLVFVLAAYLLTTRFHVRPPSAG